MCGIAGIVWKEEISRDQQRQIIQKMTDALAHRGPDGEGFWSDKKCVLGHRRLSIIDLRGGAQPMRGQEAGCVVTFNGEIYGFEEIRKNCDYAFETASDSEIILALYHQYKAAAPKHLPGMFAFALWDEKQQTLFCARDRFGEKPFFYAWGKNGEFIFASEIAAIIQSGLVKPCLHSEALGHYLQKLYVHPNATIFSNIFVLPAAHSLRWQNGEIQVERYWEMPISRDRVDEIEATEQFRELLQKAVARQLRADVPIAAFLSGGLDSSSIVAIAAQQKPDLQTLAFGFGENQSELGYARELAQRYRTQHIELQSQNYSLADTLLRMAEVYDEPLADSSNIPTYLIAGEARRHVKVVLGGDGGDELLAGYDFWYRPLWDVEHAPQWITTFYRALQVARKVSRVAGVSDGVIARWHRAASLRRSGRSLGEIHDQNMSFFSEEELKMLGIEKPWPVAREATLQSVLRGDLQTYLAGDILVKTDRATMAHGLELRAPFLDVEFASFCLSLPENLKMDNQTNKKILRLAMADSWTPSIRKRGKQGFGAPVEQWLKNPQVNALKTTFLSNRQAKLFQFLPFAEVQKLAIHDDYRTWTLLVLALWFERGLGRYL